MRRHLAIAGIVLVAAALTVVVNYRVNAQGTTASPTSTVVLAAPGPMTLNRLNDQGTPETFVAYPAQFPYANDPLPPAESEEQVICGHHLAVHWEGRTLVVDGPDGTPVTTPCGTPGATPEASPSAGP